MYIGIVIGLKTLPPFIMASFRFGLAALILFLVCFLRGEKWVSGGIYQNLVLGTIIITGGQGLLFWSEQYIASGSAAILYATLPLWYVLLDRRNRGFYLRNRWVLVSLIIGFLGIILLFRSASAIALHHNDAPIGILAVLGGCICWASGTLYYKNHPNSRSLLWNLAWQLTGGVISSLLISYFSGEFVHFTLRQVSMDSWLATVYITLAGSLAAFIAFNWLLTVRPAAVVGTYAYVNPAVALLLGWAIAHETIRPLQIMAMGVILVSAFLANSVRYRSANKISRQNRAL
ncbi:MAG: EamA family transporter [Bacteroidota bacterium]|nr:EamA family transporter [Bacteroidota bacterium]